MVDQVHPYKWRGYALHSLNLEALNTRIVQQEITLLQ